MRRPPQYGSAVLVTFGLLLALAAPVCGQGTQPPAPEAMTAPPAPPAAVAETPPASPGASYVWIAGSQAWRPYLKTYVWLPGHYTVPPAPNFEWVSGYWAAASGGGYVWVEGHWRVR
jgi:hypothetical protein